MVCGRNHSAMVTAEGRVYCWGAASFGRLGHADAKKKQSVPLAVPFFSTIPVHSLSSGDFHMLALGHNCAVYSWGYGAEGQCGHGNTFHLHTPRQIDFFNSLSVVRLACGASWSMAITKSGDLYGWGYNEATASPLTLMGAKEGEAAVESIGGESPMREWAQHRLHLVPSPDLVGGALGRLG